MTPKCIIFDLDGTLTDSGVGIKNCAKATLAHYRQPIPDEAGLRAIIGPPLRDSFARLGIPDDKIDEAVAFYRSIYNVTGKFENFPYPGIEELLQKLKKDGHRLFVATSKPEGMSVEILEHFGMAHYFEHICGAAMDGIRDKKAAVIAYLLGKTGGCENTVMIGDTVFDVQGASEHNIPTIAVSWGYGDMQAMKDAGARAAAHSMEDLYALLSE